jgi:hypothetical protein
VTTKENLMTRASSGVVAWYPDHAKIWRAPTRWCFTVLAAVLVGVLVSRGLASDDEKKVVSKPDKVTEKAPKNLPQGSWKQSDTEKVNLVRFEPSRMVQLRDGELRFVRVVYQDERIFRLGIGGSKEPLGKLRVEKDALFFEDPAGKKHKFQRLAKDPPELTLVSINLADPKFVDPKKVEEVQRELARREKVGGKLRQEFRAELKDNAKRADKIKEMVKADADDTHFLIDLIKEIGWIDSSHFGYAAQESAFLILMHTANPALKEAALPTLKKEVLAGRFDAESYAGLYDRFCFQVCLPDRYGMHVSPDATGRLVVGPLEDRARVDEFRKEIGLGPLAKYLERRKEENGGKAVRILD